MAGWWQRGNPALVLFLTIAASANAEKSPDTQRITYDDHVLPILEARCFAFHDQGARKGGLALDSYTSLLQGGSSGAVVQPGDPDASRLFLAVSRRQRPFMPPGNRPLTDDQLQVIERWIRGGLLENASSKPTLPKKPSTQLRLPSPAHPKSTGPAPLPRELSLQPAAATQGPGSIVALDTSPRAPLVAVGAHGQILLHHTARRQLVGILPFPEGVPFVLRFSPDGRLLLAGGGKNTKSGRVVVWDVVTGTRTLEIGKELDAVLAADLSPDREHVALGGPGGVVKVLRTDDGKPVHELTPHTDWIQSLAFSPDGVLLATADRAGGLRVWETRTGREFHVLSGHKGAITDLAWRPDSNVLASASEDATVRLWEMKNGRSIATLNAHPGGATSVDYGPDGSLATAGRDGKVRLWTPAGKPGRTLEGLTDIALRVRIDRSGGTILGGDWKGNLQIWNAKTGKLLGTLDTHPVDLASRVKRAQAEEKKRRKAQEAAAKSERDTRQALEKARKAHQQATEKAKQSNRRLARSSQEVRLWQTESKLAALEAKLAPLRQEVAARSAAHESLHKASASLARGAQEAGRQVKDLERLLTETRGESQEARTLRQGYSDSLKTIRSAAQASAQRSKQAKQQLAKLKKPFDAVPQSAR